MNFKSGRAGHAEVFVSGHLIGTVERTSTSYRGLARGGVVTKWVARTTDGKRVAEAPTRQRAAEGLVASVTEHDGAEVIEFAFEPKWRP